MSSHLHPHCFLLTLEPDPVLQLLRSVVADGEGSSYSLVCDYILALGVV